MSNLNPLRKICDNTLTDKDTVHSYLDTYHKLFSSKRDKNINILEVGIDKGGSLILWNDYFINGEIHGVDVLNPPERLNNYPRIKTYKFNGYNKHKINTYFNNIKFDIIIDDGPHTLKSMCMMAKHYNSLLKPDGIFIIEDIPKYDWIPIIQSKFPVEFQKYMTICDLRHVKNRFDDLMIIIDKSNDKTL